ncbi:MAG: thiamine-phosphate kinase [Sandaracinaceae bacterium]|nr:thiamine-phosphate kinase [Sandaracinaceae bacterium]
MSGSPESEDELVRALRERLATDDGRVTTSIGDDAAVLADGTVISVDASVEGAHFRREWLSLPQVGFRGTVAALSDLAAMGASPVAVLSSVVAPETSEVQALMDGVGEAAHLYGAPVIGGNVARANHLALHTTVIGRTRAPWTRAGARVGDAVYVTGTVGAAALGWRALEAGRDLAPFIARWRRPRARFDLAPFLAPTACIDVSDGVALDLARLCHASGVAARIELARLPVEAGFAEACATMGLDPDALAIGGGEDYELLFTMPASLDPSVATRVGEIVEGEAVHVLGRDGVVERGRGGHQHF